jgi:hypothetical protein
MVCCARCYLDLVEILLTESLGMIFGGVDEVVVLCMEIALLKEVGEFQMDPHRLLVADAEGLSVDKTLDGGQLIKQNQVGVLHIVVYSVKIAL